MSEPRFRPVEALRALSRLLQDPSDTEQAFRVVRAMDGGHIGSLYLRFGEDARGRALLEAKPSLLATLADRARLSALPAGSLAHAYLAFCDREGITPGGLVEASAADERELLPPDLRFMADRLRDSHDLWHVVTGCRTDLMGELAVLTFSTAQTEGPGIGLLAMAGFLRSFQLPSSYGRRGRALVRHAWRAGRDADWLPVADWEALLPRPLDEVRETLRITPMPAYEPLYRETLEALAA